MLHFMLIVQSILILLLLGSPVSAAINFYQQRKHIAEKSAHRQLCCLQGSELWCQQQALSIIKHSALPYRWCGEAPSSVTCSDAKSLLGQDVCLLILNMHKTFDANMFAAAEGSVCAGSVIVLLLPEQQSEIDCFSHYMQQQLKRHQFPILLENQSIANTQPQVGTAKPSSLLLQHLDIPEQQLAIHKIIKTVTGHRKRPLVLTANRGRGKSAALGMAAAKLINQGLMKIIVCAPSKQAVTTLYKHAKLTINEANNLQRLQFMAPDALNIEQPACDLLIIDEAAAIPIKLLAQFAQRYSRVVFATTQFGYEGSGRGFALRFLQQLKLISPQYRTFQLEQPVRWAKDDPVEAFTLSSLCLMESTLAMHILESQQKTQIRVLKKTELLQSGTLLNQIFSLLVNAHYQTKPSDLVALLNDQDLTLIVMQQEDKILAVALVKHEGGLDNITSEQIYQGKRRPVGHLIAQSLTFHSGFELAATQRFARIQRIAVQPDLQQQSFGSQLLNWIVDWATTHAFDHLSASFAGSDYLLRFWLKNQLQVLRIGTRKDKSSGQHSLMVNLPLSQQGEELHHQIQTDFHKQVKVQLSRQLNQLDASLVAILWPQIVVTKSIQNIKQSLSAYINAHRGYENVEYLLIELLHTTSLKGLTQQQQRCVIEKIIQNHSWQSIVQTHQFSGQKQAQTFLKNCICDLLTKTTTTEENTQYNETR